MYPLVLLQKFQFLPKMSKNRIYSMKIYISLTSKMQNLQKKWFILLSYLKFHYKNSIK